MPDIPSVEDLVKQVIDAASGAIDKDLSTVSGFSKSQLKQIGEQTVWLAEADATGSFAGNPGLRDHFVKGIEELTRNFVNVLQGMLIVTIEKMWNAIVGVLWGVLDKALGFALPRPIF